MLVWESLERSGGGDNYCRGCIVAVAVVVVNVGVIIVKEIGVFLKSGGVGAEGES